MLYASLTTGGETKKFYRYQSPDDNIVDYYDETGKSAKKFLVRKPVSEGIMTSPFGDRNHPLLHISQDAYRRRLGGADRHADLRLRQRRDREDRPGRRLRQIHPIRHANGYETAYGHMSAFARNMEEGSHVRQGQVIGYVGSTGLSTGSHVHYEILINGRFVDPMKVKLPRGRVLEGPLLAGFEEQRDKLDQVLARATPAARVAQTASAATDSDRQRATRQSADVALDREPPHAAAASLPLKASPCLPAEITTFSPSFTRPDRIISASGSCTDFWITRLSGRAP